LAFAVMTGVIVWDNLWALTFLHIFVGGLWTGIDLFMGFVVGPVLRKSPFEARRSVMLRLTPRTIFLLPVLSIATGTTGWYLAKSLGYLDAPWPAYGWVVAALCVVTILTLQGVGLLLPTQIRVYLELRKQNPDQARIAWLTGSYFYIVAAQGVLQVVILVIMARFRMGI
ncbi:MAG: hypothetical protein JWO28_293, partial [Hyphomicrobiales bacterium]|nr:hypothetical protein [Hyphomicrobiales bacterium]